MSYLIFAFIVWMIVGGIVQWKQYKKGAMDVVHFYELSDKWYIWYPLWGTVAWPMVVYYWMKTKKD
jgi:hypothetical protein